jgi:hypothetical protein
MENLNIYYFDKDYFFEYVNRWKQGKVNITPPLDLSWNHFFKQERKNCDILDKFEFKPFKPTISDKVFDTHTIFILENDFLWHEAVPSYENGKFFNIFTNRLYSISSLNEASKTYKNLFKEKYRHNFGEDWFLDSTFTILNRENKLKEIGI